MKKPSANVAGMFPFWAASDPLEARQHADRLDVGEDQQEDREHDHAEDLGRDADVVQDRQEPDAIGVDQRRDDERPDGDEREHRGEPAGAGRVEELTSPVVPTRDPCNPSTTKATITATALTVTTWAQK